MKGWDSTRAVGRAGRRFRAPGLRVGLAMVICGWTGMLSGQWFLSALHPDPTPPLGAPDAEYVALTLLSAGDSCNTLEGWSIEWNGNGRTLSSGCWTEGTVVVVHRAADSAEVYPGSAVPMPLISWPALLNSGGTVVLRDDGGGMVDAITYTEEQLGGGGRPLLRMDPAACGAAENVDLWGPGQDPFRALGPVGSADGESTEEALRRAREPGRLVPRGPGELEWYVGGTLDPVTVAEAQAWVGGGKAVLTWRGDSVANIRWSDRRFEVEGPTGPSLPVALGPLASCHDVARPRMFTTELERFGWSGRIEAVGVLSDPVPGDPGRPHEAIALHNASAAAVDLGPWSFGGARLLRRRVLIPDSMVWLDRNDFEGWPGLPNAGGSLVLQGPRGNPRLDLEWSPCDHVLPDLAGQGLELVRSAGSEGGWTTAGFGSAPQDPPRIVGYGCPADGSGLDSGVWIHLNRYVDHWPGDRWELEGRTVTVSARRMEGQPRAVRLHWEGWEVDVRTPQGAALHVWRGQDILDRLVVRCPSMVGEEGLPPCIRMTELMWNAAEDGAEYAEVENCGGAPLDLAGLQASTESVPLPGDWDTWVGEDQSLVLAPGDIMAFGPCARWMGNGLPARGPHRWSAEGWSALNDGAGSLSIRLRGMGESAVDRVEWTNDMRGPWWWSEDGWAWVRSGGGTADWSPAPDRGSPGARGLAEGSPECRNAVWVEEDRGFGPSIAWSLPDAGGTIVVRMVEWPTGMLRRTEVIREVWSSGRWSADEGTAGGWAPSTGPLVWEVGWWGATCRGRRRFVVRIP